MLLFRKKKREEADITDIEKSVSQNAMSIDKQIDDISGDIGLVTQKKKKAVSAEKKKSFRLKKKELHSSKTVQEAIPYKRVYMNGIFETKDGVFSKCYKLVDANFRTATPQVQEDMYYAYGTLLNYFTPECRPQFIIYNRKIDREKFQEETLFHDKDDNHNDLRHDLNNVLISKISEGQNDIVQEKYLVVSILTENIELANNAFARIDGEVSARIKAINGVSTDPMTLEERLALLYNIYNPDALVPFFKKVNIDGNEARAFDIEWMHKLGLTTKDIVAPDSLEYNRDYFRMGDKYGRSLFLRNLPTTLPAGVLTTIADVPCTAITSLYFSPMRQDEGVKLIRNQMLEINRNVVDAVQRASKAGVSPDLISPDLRQSKEDAEKAYNDITVENQKTMLMTVVVTVFADSKEDLEKYTKIAQNNAATPVCTLTKLASQQEAGFNSCIPVGDNQVWGDRLMNSESAALFIPFESQELTQPGGNYYGVNATSRSLIMMNRLRGQNSNGLILGMPGSGKSFLAKLEMAQVFLGNTKNEIFVIDPQAEYRPLCEALDGQVIRISPSSDTHINPFDMDITADAKNGDDPVTVKSDYICSICASAIGGRYGLNPVQISVIDRCVRHLYEPYLEHMQQLKNEGSTVTCDRDASPTFKQFYDLMARQPEPDAEYIRLAIEKYCVGSYNTFAFKTNIQTNNRFVVYDIRDIGTGMNEMGMQVCLNDIWNRTIANRARNVRTWIYIDELYVLTQSEECARFLMYMWKQFRKYGGVPTGITQNVEDLLTNRESRGIINNSPFIVLLNQSADDRLEIGNMLHISEQQLEFIKNADSGQGLIYTGQAIVPFINKFSKNGKLYNIITTNPND